MTGSISTTLNNYGFDNGFWGCGSLVRGITATVAYKGGNVYVVRYHKWEYDCEGEVVIDTEETVSLYGAQMLQYLFEKLPLFR